MIDICDSKIYIFCPANSVSGGPEALHQLQFYMRECGIESYLVYYFSSVKKCPPRYEIYEPNIIDYTEVEDNEKNLLIVPETATSFMRFYNHIRTCVWWLGVHAYFWMRTGKNFIKDCIKSGLNLFVKKKYVYSYPVNLKKANYHMCGSRYAFDFLKSFKYNYNPAMLVEPISKQFYNVESRCEMSSQSRDDIILYNPARPSQIMDKLLMRNDLQFKPLKGYTLDELVDIYRQAKLYIDFGEFPGPERIPKESVYNGTCLLVGRRNASENDFDIPIPEEYKIVKYNDEETVVAKIKYILNNYDQCINDFDFFRTKIDNLETMFMKQIDELFIR